MEKIYWTSSERMDEVDSGSVKLVVTHPPYLDISSKDYRRFMISVLGELYRCLDTDGILVLVNTDVKKTDFYPKHILLHDVSLENGFILRDEKIWVRTENNRFDRMGFSFIQIFSKGDYKRLVIDPLFEKGIWNLPYSMNIGKFRDAFHPDIPRRCINVFTKPNDLVLDPFLGSGTTLYVSLSMNRDFVGYEIDKSLKPLVCQKLEITPLI